MIGPISAAVGPGARGITEGSVGPFALRRPPQIGAAQAPPCPRRSRMYTRERGIAERVVGRRHSQPEAGAHKVLLQRTIALAIMLGMASNRRSEEDKRRILRCAACEGTVFAETAPSRSDANTACALCGMTLAESSAFGGDYFDVLMRVGRPIRREARLRRAG